MANPRYPKTMNNIKTPIVRKIKSRLFNFIFLTDAKLRIDANDAKNLFASFACIRSLVPLLRKYFSFNNYLGIPVFEIKIEIIKGDEILAFFNCF